MNKLFTLCALLIGVPSLLTAQAITGDIPYAKKLLKPDRSLKVWTIGMIQDDKTLTINPGGDTIRQKDVRSKAKMLGYSSLAVEKDDTANNGKDTSKKFSGTLDLTNAVLSAKIAILVDDNAILQVKEILAERKEGIEGPAFTDTFEVDGTALWNPRSYKEFSTLLPIGRKYKLDLTYSNTANLTPNYEGEIDVDGVSVYVSLFLLPVEVMVNDTDEEEDDLVAVPKGVDEDLATDFSVKVSGMGGLTADLKVKGTDGGLKFKDPTLTLTDGAETKTKLWGTSPSSDKDKTIIEITLKKDGSELGKIEEEVTVFKGAKLEFEGNFYINVDTRELARRPWDGRADPKPNSKGDMTGNTAFMTAEIGASPTAAELAAYKKAVDQSFSFGYESAISFKEGDNASIPNYKPWKDNLEVKVTKVMAKQPSFEITGDQMKDAVISLKNGHLEGPDANETLVDPEVSIADFLTLEKVTNNTDIAFKANGAQTVTDAQVAAQITAARGGGYDELLDFFARRTGALAGFSGMRFEWMNDTFEVKKEARIKDSFAATAIKGEKENGGKVEVKWFFTKWNEFKFQGDLDDAVIETK